MATMRTLPIRRYAPYAIAVLVLLVIYSLRFGGLFGADGESGPAQVAALQADIDRLTAEQAEARALEAALRTAATRVWVADPDIPTNQVQAAIQRLGLSSGLELNRIGAPREVSLGDSLRAVEVQVSATCELAEIAAFAQAVDNHSPALEWVSCTIRPERGRPDGTLSFHAKLRAVVVPKASLHATAAAGRPSTSRTP